MNSNILLLVLLGFSKEYCHTKMSNLNDKSVSLLDDNNSAQSEHENSLVSDVEKINKPLLNEENSLSDEDPDVVELQNLIAQRKLCTERIDKSLRYISDHKMALAKKVQDEKLITLPVSAPQHRSLCKLVEHSKQFDEIIKERKEQEEKDKKAKEILQSIEDHHNVNNKIHSSCNICQQVKAATEGSNENFKSLSVGCNTIKFVDRNVRPLLSHTNSP